MATTKIEWAEKDDIRLLYADRGWGEMEGIVSGHFAIHIVGRIPMKLEDESDDDVFVNTLYSLSHLPTGMTICKCVRSENDAKILAEKLNKLDMDWGKIRQHAKGTGAKEIVEKFKKEFNVPVKIDGFYQHQDIYPQPEDGA